MRPLRTEAVALLEVGLLFLPAIPAFIWLWPAVDNTPYLDWVQALVYLYVLGGTLLIGRRRWSWSQFGATWRGLGLGLACGSALIAEELLAFVALGYPLRLRLPEPGRLAGEIVFYFGLVGVVEELLFRGLVFHILESWHGPALAIVGSSLGFALWHVGWMGVFIFAPFLIGLFLALVRWRAGGIAGLVLVHGVYDLLSTWLDVPSRPASLGELVHLAVASPWAAVAGDALLLAVVFFLWKVYPHYSGRSA